MSDSTGGLAERLGFGSGEPVSMSGGFRVYAMGMPGIGKRYLVLMPPVPPPDAYEAVLPDTLPGICKAITLDSSGETMDEGEWLVFGGDTPIPIGDSKGWPLAVLVENIRL